MRVTCVMTFNDPNLTKGQNFLWHEIISQDKKREANNIQIHV